MTLEKCFPIRVGSRDTLSDVKNVGDTCVINVEDRNSKGASFYFLKRISK